ncbi:hypothetical protein OAV62_02095 [bacterium]|nr:hypothetical protein [bacterium]
MGGVRYVLPENPSQSVQGFYEQVRSSIDESLHESTNLVVAFSKDGLIKALGSYSSDEIILSAYISSLDYYEIIQSQPATSNVTAVFRDPAPQSQLALGRILFSSKPLGMLKSDAVYRVNSYLDVLWLPVESPSKPFEAISQYQDDIAALILLPDSSLLNRRRISGIVRYLYKENIGVIGYSEKMIKGGVLAAAYVEPEYLLAETLVAISLLAADTEIPPSFVKNVSIKMNYLLARKLNVKAVGSEKELTKLVRKLLQEGDDV